MMWHVDEGALHAYLDGALDEYPAAEARRVREHLEACLACAGRLAEARALRDEAARVLSLAAPLVDVPALEDLRARLRADEPGRPRVSARIYRIGWAASVVLALGTGWVLRGGVPNGSSRAAQDPLAVPASAADAALPSGQAGPGAAAATESAGATEAANAAPLAAPGADSGEGRVAAAPRAEPYAPGSAAAEVVAGAAPRAPVPGADGGRDTGEPATGDVAGDLVAAAEARVRSIEPSLTIPSPALEPLRLRVVAPEPVERPRGTETAAAPSGGARPDSGRRADVERGVLTSATSAGGAAPGLSLGRSTRAGDDTPAEAGDEPISLVVPGLEVIGVQPVGEGTTFAGMRALQRLPGGDTLEIFHLPESVHPATLPSLAAGHNQLVRQRGEGWVVLRALLTEPELEALLQRLESGS